MTEARRRILVVDDDPGTAAILRAGFGGRPYDIVEARDGEEGCRLAESLLPDVVIMDVEMPVMDGLEATRRIKRGPRTEGLPVVVLTARRLISDKVQGLDAGADHYITKPFEFVELDAMVRGAFRQRDAAAAYQSKIGAFRGQNRQLEELLVVDEKTGLANYRAFKRRLADEWARAARYGASLSVVMFDLDDFKKINDTWGHPAGDRVLGEFAMLLGGGARSTDLAARFGGEEFAMILPHTENAMAMRVAERIRTSVQEFVFCEPEHPLRATVSVGVATYPSDPSIDSAEALVRSADRALYRAKDGGKNRVIAASG